MSIQLTNKQTGESGELHFNEGKEYCFTVVAKDPTQTRIYKTLGEVLKDWKDFIVIEREGPLIKDPKVRKAVRAWAEANGISELLVIKMAGRLEISDGSPHLIYISFHADEETMNNLNDRTYYPIAELCGSEE